MSLTFFVFALMGLVSLQACAEARHLAVRDNNADFQKALQDMENANEAGIKRLLDSQEGLNELLTSLITETQDIVNADATKVRALLDELLKEASELGESAEKCVDSAGEKVDPLVRESKVKIEAGVNTVFSELSATMEKGIETAEINRHKIVTVEEVYAKCEDSSCQEKIIQYILGETPQVKIAFEQLIAGNVVTFEHLASTLSDVRSAMSSGTKNIEKEARQCLQLV